MNSFEVNVTDYITEFFNKVQEKSALSQIFFITSFIIMKIGNVFDWIFLFIDQNNLDNTFISFNSQLKICEGFAQLLSRNMILDSLNHFNLSLTPTLEIITRLLQQTYLTKTSLNVSGLTSYNLFIFINANTDKLQFLNRSPLSRAIIYIVLLNELAHALRRTTAKTLAESREMLTPPESQDSLFVFDENDAEQQLAEIRGESGFKAEKMIFGKKVKEITSKAAVYFLECSADVTHDEFKKTFAELQKEGPGNPVRRESVRTKIGRCLFSGQE